jgi:hypothetical protein
MESVGKERFGLFTLPTVAACEWLLILPASALLAAAAFRVLQPRQYEPARSSWIIFEWTSAHVSQLGAAILFIGMPGIVVTVGCAVLLRNWRQHQALRQDSATMIAILRRHLAIVLLAAAVLFAGTILAAVAAHVLTD